MEEMSDDGVLSPNELEIVLMAVLRHHQPNGMEEEEIHRQSALIEQWIMKTKLDFAIIENIMGEKLSVGVRADGEFVFRLIDPEVPKVSRASATGGG